jgi:hypothetical protein
MRLPALFAHAVPLTALLLISCAAEPTAQATATPAPNTGDMVCTREYPIGSNIPVTKCRTREQIEADKAAAQEGLRRTQTGGPNAKMGGGG